jgi:hypothetical protein
VDSPQDMVRLVMGRGVPSEVLAAFEGREKRGLADQAPIHPSCRPSFSCLPSTLHPCMPTGLMPARPLCDSLHSRRSARSSAEVKSLLLDARWRR